MLSYRVDKGHGQSNRMTTFVAANVTQPHCAYMYVYMGVSYRVAKSARVLCHRFPNYKDLNSHDCLSSLQMIVDCMIVCIHTYKQLCVLKHMLSIIRIYIYMYIYYNM